MSHKHPFIIDPFAWVYEAYRAVFADAPQCIVLWDEVVDEAGEEMYGSTTFPDNDNEMIVVRVNPNIPVYGAVEVLAHELAHIAVGASGGHGEQWVKAFDRIQQQYVKMSEEAVPEGYERKWVGNSQPPAGKLQ